MGWSADYWKEKLKRAQRGHDRALAAEKRYAAGDWRPDIVSEGRQVGPSRDPSPIEKLDWACRRIFEERKSEESNE